MDATGFLTDSQPLVHVGDDGVVRLAGEIDLANTDELVGAVLPLLSSGTDVLLNLADLTFIDSTGLGTLLQLRREAARSGSRLTISEVNGRIRRVFEISGLAPIFGVDCPGQGEARTG